MKQENIQRNENDENPLIGKEDTKSKLRNLKKVNKFFFFEMILIRTISVKKINEN